MTQTKLSESELQQIREEAEELYPAGEYGNKIKQSVHIAAVTVERERATEVVEALELLVRACRGEELKWNEIKWAETAINNYKKINDDPLHSRIVK